ncbi:hypothetical protein AB205_0194980 [Aquarana catesbeiana]|uniref:Uncharacterized protein n=1 Tax=Aquarana catesbeiana TaxID=8400 RepID=A0A2G9Q2T4_AQUCT|nr:hypothetical protein AB205_0194980 [Aquarana catesbeiana]
MGTPPGDLVVLESSNNATPEDVYEVCDMGTPPGQCLRYQLMVR